MNTDKPQHLTPGLRVYPGFLVHVHRLAQICPLNLVTGNRQSDLRQDSAGARNDLIGQSQVPVRQFGRKHHAHRVSLAMTPREMLVGLNSVGQGVTIVEPLASDLFSRRRPLVQISAHHTSLDGNRTRQHLNEGLGSDVEGQPRMVGDDVENHRVFNKPAFDDLSQARTHLSRWQGRQQFRITQDADGLMEGSNKVFPGRNVDTSFAANRSVGHSQHSRRNVDDVNPSHPCCG